ncbi:hypothetical protein HU200_045173 [Digitaria exilis]|uniref:Uncharacterized protein n=1 Tax=Digitaria exilis TaxID=1010633 RepID=A0A835BB50_9POAL|nr:hypothetical protein HU200_045173 [Digitaria exilis]
MAARAANGKNKESGDESGNSKESPVDLDKFAKYSKFQEENHEKCLQILQVQQKLSSEKIEASKIAHLTAQENKEVKKLEKESKMMEAYLSISSQDTSSMSAVEKAERVAVMKCLRQKLFPGPFASLFCTYFCPSPLLLSLTMEPHEEDIEQDVEDFDPMEGCTCPQPTGDALPRTFAVLASRPVVGEAANGHPSVVGLRDVVEDAATGDVFLVMEFVTGAHGGGVVCVIFNLELPPHASPAFARLASDPLHVGSGSSLTAIRRRICFAAGASGPLSGGARRTLVAAKKTGAERRVEVDIPVPYPYWNGYDVQAYTLPKSCGVELVEWIRVSIAAGLT